MGWNEKFDALERAALLYGDHVITVDEFRTIKGQILQLTVDDDKPIDYNKMEDDALKSLDVIRKQIFPTSACTNTVEAPNPNHFLKSEDWIRKTGTGSTQPSNLGSVVEKDYLLDGEVTNAPMKRFKDDFERINVGDSPAADYY